MSSILLWSSIFSPKTGVVSCRSVVDRIQLGYGATLMGVGKSQQGHDYRVMRFGHYLFFVALVMRIALLLNDSLSALRGLPTNLDPFFCYLTLRSTHHDNRYLTLHPQIKFCVDKLTVFPSQRSCLNR